jgi:hypothetical protein
MGGRLFALLNSISLAEALGTEYCLDWPATEEWGFQKPEEIFSAAYLKQTAPERFTYKRALGFSKIAHMTLEEARQWSRETTVETVIKVKEFNILKFSNETEEQAEDRFNRAFWSIRWSVPISRLINKLNDAKTENSFATYHLRCGDIIHGAWRQFVPTEKYTPKYLVQFILELQLKNNKGQLVILSDSPHYVQELIGMYDAIQTPNEILPEYEHLSIQQQTICDIVIMAFSSQIYGPRDSIFSSFAARLNRKPIISVIDVISSNEGVLLFKDYMKKLKKESFKTDRFVGQRTARDICWSLEVFSDQLTTDTMLAWAQRAQNYDPEYCVAINHTALMHALKGDQDQARKENNRALFIAARTSRHQDPFTQSLITRSIIQNIKVNFNYKKETYIYRLKSRFLNFWLFFPLYLLYLMNIFLKVILKLQKFVGFTIIRQISNIYNSRIPSWFLSFAISLTRPYQTNRSEISRNLTYQKFVGELLRVFPPDDDPLNEASLYLNEELPETSDYWRFSGFDILKAGGRFPEYLRKIEALSLNYAVALRRLMSNNPDFKEIDSDLDYIETEVDNTGLQWVSGRFTSTSAISHHCCVCFVQGETIVSAGPLLPSSILKRISDRKTVVFLLPVPCTVDRVERDDFRLLSAYARP